MNFIKNFTGIKISSNTTPQDFPNFIQLKFDGFKFLKFLKLKVQPTRAYQTAFFSNSMFYVLELHLVSVPKLGELISRGTR